MLPLLAALDTAQTAKGLEEHPLAYFLAIVLGAVGVLWTAFVHAQWGGARRERDLFKKLLEQEEKRSAELKRERNEARDETDHVRAEHMRGLIKLEAATQGLIRMRDDYKLAAAKDPTP